MATAKKAEKKDPLVVAAERVAAAREELAAARAAELEAKQEAGLLQ